MSTERPQVGEISADGQFRWDGAEWSPLARGHREPTSWTLPLRRIAAAFLAVYALVGLLTNVLFVTEPALERSLRASNAQLTEDQVRSAATLGYTLGWITVGLITVIVLVLAIGSLRGWRWTFWVDLAALALMSIGVVTNAFALASPAVQTLPSAAIAVNLLISLAALGLLIWFIVAAARFGPWAMRRPGA
jgi:predicted ferric reductase